MIFLPKEPFDLFKFLFGTIRRKLTFLFLLIGIIAPSFGIYYFLSISNSLITSNPGFVPDQIFLLDTTAFLIIILIAVNTAVVGFFVSRAIAKPIILLHNAAKEIEKGNFNIRTDIKTRDEIAKLGDAINMSAIALGKMEQERKQLDKAKSEFLSMTSHELRTPITPLKAQIQMLQQQYFGKITEKQRASLGIVLKNTERLSKMIEDFLEISRIEAARLKFHFRQVDIKECVEELVQLMKGFAKEKNVRITTYIEEMNPVEMDPDRVSQVLGNLINNAIKFSRKNGIIEVNVYQKGENIYFSVKDNGLGISPQDQIRVFEPFYQSEETVCREHEGTGLGLAICRGIVESQKGRIWVESTLGQGSVFSFYFPKKPVKDIEPIKVLFSLKSEIEKELKEQFILLLGPMGIVEFNELKNKNSIGHKEIIEYIESLNELKILNNLVADGFKTDINRIFGDYSTDNIEEIKK